MNFKRDIFLQEIKMLDYNSPVIQNLIAEKK